MGGSVLPPYVGDMDRPFDRRGAAPPDSAAHPVKRGRIDPLPGGRGGWILYYVPWGSRHGFTTTHERLSSAMTWAAHYERLSVRRANRVRHAIFALVVTVVALFLLVLSFAFGGPVMFISGALLLFFGLHELADLLDSVVPDEASDAVDRRMARFDALLGWLLERLERALVLRGADGGAGNVEDPRGEGRDRQSVRGP